jgi:hypothetical protein
MDFCLVMMLAYTGDDDCAGEISFLLCFSLSKALQSRMGMTHQPKCLISKENEENKIKNEELCAKAPFPISEKFKLEKCQSHSAAPSPQKKLSNLLRPKLRSEGEREEKSCGSSREPQLRQRHQPNNNNNSNASSASSQLNMAVDGSNNSSSRERAENEKVDEQQQDGEQSKPAAGGSSATGRRMRKMSDGVMNTLGVLWGSGRTTQI